MQQISELAMTEFELGLIVPAILTSRLGKFWVKKWEYIICGEKKIFFGENKDA
jgi:hypothetical protein